MNLCNHFRKDIETCKLDGMNCPYEDDWKECLKLIKKKSRSYQKEISNEGMNRIADMFNVPVGKSYKSKMDDLINHNPSDDDMMSLSDMLYDCVSDDSWIIQVTNSRAPDRTKSNIDTVRFYMNIAADDMGRGMDWKGALSKIWAIYDKTGYKGAIDSLHSRCFDKEV